MAISHLNLTRHRPREQILFTIRLFTVCICNSRPPVKSPRRGGDFQPIWPIHNPEYVGAPQRQGCAMSPKGWPRCQKGEGLSVGENLRIKAVMCFTARDFLWPGIPMQKVVKGMPAEPICRAVFSFDWD